MDDIIQIARSLEKLGTAVFEVPCDGENLYSKVDTELYQSEMNGVINDQDDFIGVEVESPVDTDEPLALVKEKDQNINPGAIYNGSQRTPAEDVSQEGTITENPLQPTPWNMPRPFTLITIKQEIPEISSTESPEHPSAEISPVTSENLIPEGDDFTRYETNSTNIRMSCTFEECFKSFSNKANLNQHVRDTHYKIKNYMCHLCAHRFARRSTLLRHENNHTGEKYFPCNICGEKFLGDFKLEFHQMTKHTEDDKQRKSTKNILPKKSKVPSVKLDRENNNYLACQKCNASFIFSVDLEQHECKYYNSGIYANSSHSPAPAKATKRLKKVNVKKEPKNKSEKVPCSVCHKPLCKNYVKTHESVYHFNIVVYTCFICFKTFKTMSSVNQHVQYVHYALKNYVCEFCQKGFSRKACYQRHMKLVHKNETLQNQNDYYYWPQR